MPQVPVHSGLNSVLVFFMGVVGKVGLLNVTRLLYTVLRLAHRNRGMHRAKRNIYFK